MQLPDILMYVDAATHFSEALLARRANSGPELYLNSSQTCSVMARMLVPRHWRKPERLVQDIPPDYRMGASLFSQSQAGVI